MLIKTIIRQTIKITNEVLKTKTTKDVRDKIYKHFAEDSNQFDTVRKTDTIQSLISDLDWPYKPTNYIQRLTGLNTTPYAQREIKYTKCIMNHINLVTAELRFRGIMVKEKTKIIELKRILKIDNMARQAVEIKRTTNTHTRDDKLDATYFKPLYWSAV